MSYLWKEFNIKTYPAETLIFRDGVFCKDLSEYESCDFNQRKNLISINKTPILPIHIIYIGEIAGDIELNININAKNTEINMDFRTINKTPVFLNIFVKNAGKHSVFNGKIIDKNYSEFKINAVAQHLSENTSIFIKTRVAAYKNTLSDLNGRAEIQKNAIDCKSDVSFMVMADEDAKIILKPTQYINAVPKNASHSAALYKPNKNQINYLRTAGLGTIEINKILEEAFLN